MKRVTHYLLRFFVLFILLLQGNFKDLFKSIEDYESDLRIN